MSLLSYSIIFFALASIFGFFLLAQILRDKNTPKFISFINGISTFIGLFLLIIYAMRFHRDDLFLFIVLFLGAALGGIILIYRDIRGKGISRNLVLFHSVLVTSALVTLVINKGF